MTISGSRGRSLSVTNTQLQDTGGYSCTVEGPSVSPKMASVSVSVEGQCLPSCSPSPLPLPPSLIPSLLLSLSHSLSPSLSHTFISPSLTLSFSLSPSIVLSCLFLYYCFPPSTLDLLPPPIPLLDPSFSFLTYVLIADPLVTVSAIPERAKLNHSLTLTCTTTSTHTPQLSWYNGSTELLSSNSRYRIIKASSGQSSLVITHFSEGDSRTRTVFHCRTNDSLSRVTDRSISVELSTELYLTRPLREQLCVHENVTLTVTCSVAGGTGSVLVRWYHDKRAVANSSQVTVRDRNITFHPVKRTMDGSYRCVATDAASQTITNPFILSVYGELS